MGFIKQKVRNIRYGTEIKSVLTAGENLMYQNVMCCSTNNGKLWCGAIIGFTNKRLLVEWQRNKGKDVAVSYDQIIGWKIAREIDGLSGKVEKIIPGDFWVVNICVTEDLTICVSNKNSELKIFVNQLKEYCPQKQIL